MKTSNPAISERVLERISGLAAVGETMTVDGTITKIGILLGLLLVGFVIPLAYPGMIPMWIMVGFIGGLIFAVATIFKPEWAPVTAPVYAFLEGLAIGSLTILANDQFPGIGIQAGFLTFGVFVSMLTAYRTGLIKVTEQFKAGVVAATGAIFVVYLISMVLNLFGIPMPYIHEAGILGIGFSIVVVGIAALNLVLDFDFIDEGAREGLPKIMEWYGAFGLMVTLIWLYIEVLRLLIKIRTVLDD
ncbi:MAG: Bax inhibitor-1/YccA family protein [Pseudomonadota bacterium]